MSESPPLVHVNPVNRLNLVVDTHTSVQCRRLVGGRRDVGETGWEKKQITLLDVGRLGERCGGRGRSKKEIQR